MKFILEINCDNAAFEGHEGQRAEVARILIKAGRKVEDCQREGPLIDINGNRVGSFRFVEDDSD